MSCSQGCFEDSNSSDKKDGMLQIQCGGLTLKPAHTGDMRIAVPVISIRIPGVTAAKIYLRGLGALCAEGEAASDMRVLRLALEVIGRQKATVAALLQKIAVQSRGTAAPAV
jgi:hypothetical protein